MCPHTAMCVLVRLLFCVLRVLACSFAHECRVHFFVHLVYAESLCTSVYLVYAESLCTSVLFCVLVYEESSGVFADLSIKHDDTYVAA